MLTPLFKEGLKQIHGFSPAAFLSTGLQLCRIRNRDRPGPLGPRRHEWSLSGHSYDRAFDDVGSFRGPGFPVLQLTDDPELLELTPGNGVLPTPSLNFQISPERPIESGFLMGVEGVNGVSSSQVFEDFHDGTVPDQQRNPFFRQGSAQITQALQRKLKVTGRMFIGSEPVLLDHKQAHSRTGQQCDCQSLMVFGPEIPLEPDKMNGKSACAHFVQDILNYRLNSVNPRIGFRGIPRNMAPITPYPVPIAEFEFSYARSSGPGGQNVNKVNSKAILRWCPGDSRVFTEDQRRRLCSKLKLNEAGELVVASDRFRDQVRNKEDCIEKFSRLIEEALHVPKVRKKTKKTRSSRIKAKENKKRHSEKKSLRSFRY